MGGRAPLGRGPCCVRRGLPRDAAASSATPKKKKTSAKSKRKGKVKGQAAPTPDRIKDIQAALQKDGSYQGEPTGKWDAATVDAMSKFQEKNGFPAPEKLTRCRSTSSDLGSETAGKGAPGLQRSRSIALHRRRPRSDPPPRQVNARLPRASLEPPLHFTRITLTRRAGARWAKPSIG